MSNSGFAPRVYTSHDRTMIIPTATQLTVGNPMPLQRERTVRRKAPIRVAISSGEAALPQMQEDQRLGIRVRDAGNAERIEALAQNIQKLMAQGLSPEDAEAEAIAALQREVQIERQIARPNKQAMTILGENGEESDAMQALYQEADDESGHTYAQTLLSEIFDTKQSPGLDGPPGLDTSTDLDESVIESLSESKGDEEEPPQTPIRTESKRTESKRFSAPGKGDYLVFGYGGKETKWVENSYVKKDIIGKRGEGKGWYTIQLRSGERAYVRPAVSPGKPGRRYIAGLGAEGIDWKAL